MIIQKFNFIGELPSHFAFAFSELAPLLNMECVSNGISVVAKRGSHLHVIKQSHSISITWHKPVQFYRALSYLFQHDECLDFSMLEEPCFEAGVMLDCSRNAVIKPSALKKMLCKMALMGMNVAMLYTEDTYEVPQVPYFGYMRGRYTENELKDLDDYAFALGIELIPCIQTLGHLGRALHWPSMQKYCDVAEVLLCDSEETYTLLEKMITAASKPFRSKRIHIGMDEAHGVGLGNHLRLNGFENPHDIIKRHLLRVNQIINSLKLTPLMWSDMYFRPDSPDNEYYNVEPTENAINSVFANTQLVYWDYSHKNESDYIAMLDKHKKLTKGNMQNVLFAGAVWAWVGLAPEYDKTFSTASAALSACKKSKVGLVFATVWGDNGNECTRATALPGMQFYAEFAYTGNYNEQHLAARFKACCSDSLQKFLRLTAFNSAYDMKASWQRPINASKFLFYQDPLVQLFTKDMEGYDMALHYKTLHNEYEHYSHEKSEYQLHMRFYSLLAKILTEKCIWHQSIAALVAQNEKQKAKELCHSFQQLVPLLEQLRLLWGELWYADNKPFGFEVLDGRVGALQARIKTAVSRVSAWADGNLYEALDELKEEVLPFGLGYMDEGCQFGVYGVGEIVSACKIDY